MDLGHSLSIGGAYPVVMAASHIEHLDERGRVTVKAPYRGRLRRGYVQVLTKDGVLFAAVPERIRADAPSLANVDDEAMKDAG